MRTIKKTKTLSLLATLLFTFTLAISFSGTAYAQEVHPDCANKWLKIGRRWCTFKKNAEALEQAITLTSVDGMTSAAADGISMTLAGRNFDQYNLCALRATGQDTGPVPSSLDSDDDCSDMRTASVLTGKYGYPTNTTSNGSLIGFTTAMQDIAFNEAPPVNLAYYARYQAAKIPVVNNTAFAQTAVEGDYFLRLFLDVWESLRNVAYGLLALVMVVIGVMIMVRHKINPQTVVTIQSAIPRIVIAVLLITFSYPIGALAMAMVVPFSAIAIGLLPIDSLSLPITTVFAGLVFAGGILIPGAGIFYLVVILALILVGVFAILKLIISIITNYAKVVYQILAAPFIFAWSAVPGNEHLVTDWFKKLAVYIITIPAMIFGLVLGVYVAWSFTNNLGLAAGATGLPLANVAGALSASFLAPILVVIIWWQTTKFPKQIEEGILGKKR